MPEGIPSAPPVQAPNPEPAPTQQEVQALQTKVLETEKNLEATGVEQNREQIAKDTINQYKQEVQNTPQAASNPEVQADAQQIQEQTPEQQLSDVIELTQTKGIKHALTVVGKLKQWHKEDDYHDYLVDHIIQGLPTPGVKEKSLMYQALHMRLFEIVLPKETQSNEKQFSELVKTMEQFYSGLLSFEGNRNEKVNYLVFELANPLGEDRAKIFVSIPETRIDLFTRQLLAIFPKAKLIPRTHDYNVFFEDGVTLGAVADLDSNPEFPLKTHEDFASDPLNVILNGFSKIPKETGAAALQVVFKPVGNSYTDNYKHTLKNLEEGGSISSKSKNSNVLIKILKGLGDALMASSSKTETADNQPPPVDTAAVEAVKKKISSPIVETNFRLVVSTKSEVESEKLLHNLESAFNQFSNAGKQSFKWKRVRTSGSRWEKLKDSKVYKSFIFRLHQNHEALPMNLEELSTILHFNTETLSTNSTLDQSKSRSAPPPQNIPDSTGTLVGINAYQGHEQKFYIAREDRLRHLYAIGQTGTGKSSFLKNLIVDDIEKGQGACFIDPHGSDVQDILSLVPKERLDDVIYFDPSSTARPMALNMLEYDPRYPEQKTFVVNELFSIFQKLYGGSPQSMGPMFEQYFRNATMLVIEDPETGSTLLDVSRVMADEEFRKLKISRCKNPIVVQFWTEVAQKAGGEASLANIVPYITSKFDVFLANDIMRPIVAQEKSSFQFREVMDNRKILLVNLAKGRLGDINANLIGLILVGKILMAALSRVDSLGKDMAPFYLYIDEFQNITTDSIATILSEARKYKLSLTIAHQFIAQLQDEIRDAVFGNVGTVCSFRVGQDDAEYLEKQYQPTFTSKDLASIDNYNGYIKTLVNGVPVDPFDFKLMPPRDGDMTQVQTAQEASFQKYGRDRTEIEAEINAKYNKPKTEQEPATKTSGQTTASSQQPALRRRFKRRTSSPSPLQKRLSAKRRPLKRKPQVDSVGDDIQ